MSDLASLRILLTPQGQEALRAAARLAEAADGYLPLLQRLRSRFPDRVARAAAAQALLRAKATDKFSRAHEMYFSREALEQATSEPIARLRAGRFRGSRRIFDLGCGLGGDALFLAEMAPVVAADWARGRLGLLRANAQALGLGNRIQPVQADITRPAWKLGPGWSGFIDPGRRIGGRRLRSTEAYQPPLSAIVPWSRTCAGMAVKVSPALDLMETSGYDCEIEFVSLHRELKEAVLWFGGFKTAQRRATVLPGPHTLTAEREPPLPSGPALAYLYEPDPAILRAGLVRTLGERLTARMIDPTIAYLTADRLEETPFARAYRVLEAFPFHLKRLRARLRQMEVGRVTVKKRGSAIRPEELLDRLRLSGSQEVTVVLTRVVGKPFVVLVQPASIDPAP